SPQSNILEATAQTTTRLTTVGKYNANPSWSKNDVIAFSARDESHNLDIYTIRADGSDLTRITQQQGKNDKPSWSPCGRYIAFSSTRDGSSRIYIATSDGKSQIAATTSGWYENPVWGH
ncbi:MAG: PD40 domain-containing protein, partial [Bradymonadales bacterium]|nr:PD40 domain-containing protein [Bradymonadales bacterium]